MKRIFYLLSVFIFGIAYSQLPNISFNGTNAWTTGTGITFDTANNSAQIIGNGTSYKRTTLTSTITSPPSEFYFYADVWLENTTFNPQNIKNPQVIVRNASDAVIYRFNIDESLQNTWFKAGIKISNYTGTSIKFEFGVNGTTGTMKVKNPLLATTAPAFTYEFPWTVPTNVTTTLNVNTTQKHNFQNDLLSTNSHFVYASYQWDSSTLQNAINTYFPMSNMRFPGGTVGNYYNYSTDTFYLNSYTPTNLQNKANSGYTFKYSGYKNFVVNSGATSTYMMNILTNTVAQSQAEYQNRINGGLPIKWLEMGNEIYLSGNQVGNVTSVTNYISHTKNLVTSIKSVNANAKLAACLDKDDFGVGSWNYTLSQDQNYFDAATMHNYNSTGVYFYNKYASYAMLKFYKISTDRFTKFQNLFPNKPLLLTEWGILTEMDLPYFVQTLGVADAFLAIEKANQQGIVQQAGTHMLYKDDNNHEATLMYYNGATLMLTSRGKMYSKLYEVFKDSEVYNAETVSAELETGLKGVNARMIKKGNVYKVFVVNKLPVSSPLVLNIDGINYTGSYTKESYTNDMSTPTNGIPATTNVWNSTTSTGSITLPASSINIITLNSSFPGSARIGASKPQDSQNIELYPNPANDVLNISGINVNEYTIYSIDGKNVTGLVKTIDKADKSLKLNVSNLKSGIYLIKTSQGSYKFLKN